MVSHGRCALSLAYMMAMEAMKCISIMVSPSLQNQLQISDAFQLQDYFEPKELFITTWDQVGYFEEKSQKVNTFQAIIGKNHQKIFFKNLKSL